MCTTWVFLDVDGVLNDYSTEDRTPNGFVGLDDDKIALLACFVHEVGADIVLTSTWKDQNLWLRELHPGADLAYLLNKLADHGLNISGYTRDGSRGTAIREWLDDHPGAGRYFR